LALASVAIMAQHILPHSRYIVNMNVIVLVDNRIIDVFAIELISKRHELARCD
jgi:hypothetical protein